MASSPLHPNRLAPDLLGVSGVGIGIGLESHPGYYTSVKQMMVIVWYGNHMIFGV